MSKLYAGLTTNGVTELTLQEEGVGNIGTQTIVWDGTTNGVIDQVQGDILDNWKSGGGIKQLQIGSSCTNIGSYAFYFCLDLTGDLVIPDSVTSIGDYAFFYCQDFDGTLTIGNSVMSIGYSAFSDCSGLTGSLVIPNSVTTIGNYAFVYCGLTGDLVIPDSVTSIGSYAFFGCAGLTALYTNTPAASWTGTNALFSTTALVNIYYGPNTNDGAGYSATFQGGSGMTVSAWTNYPNVP